MASPRYLEKFESASGGLTYTWPVKTYEWDSQQTLRVPIARLAGVGYAYDLQRSGMSLRETAAETVRFALINSNYETLDDDYDTMAATLLRAGRGKLYTIGADASRRWAWARLAEMPSGSLTGLTKFALPVHLRFVRLSDWFDSSATTDTEVVTADEQQWTVTNPGDLPARLMTIRFRANTSGGFTNPILRNLTNGYVFGVTRDSASDADEVRLRTEEATVEYSDDDGATYADDFAEYSIPTDQPVLSFQLEPGSNSLQLDCDGTPNVNVEVSFYAPHAR